MARLQAADSRERKAANERALNRLYQVRPIWCGVSKAACAVALPALTLLHAGPAFRDPRQPSAPVLSSAILCCLYEGWAQTGEQAQAMIAEGRVQLLPAQDFDVVTPLAAVISPGTALVEICDGNNRDLRCWSLLGSGGGQQLRFGSRDLAILQRLSWRDGRLYEVLQAVLKGRDIDLFELAQAGLQAGDDLHARTTGATCALVRKLLPDLEDAGDVLQMLEQTPLFFLTLWMAACHLMLGAAAGGGQDPAASLVIGLSGNGQDTGIRLAGDPERWLVSAAHTPQGPQLVPAVASPMLGDSGVIEAAGFGAQAWGHAVAVAGDVRAWLPGHWQAAPPWRIGMHPLFGQFGLGSGIDAVAVDCDSSAPYVAIAMLDALGEQGLLGRGICLTTPAQYGHEPGNGLTVNQPQAWAALNQAFERYEAALVGNDLNVLDELFWQSPHTVRYGATEELYGAQQIQAFRLERPAKGLERTINERSLTTFGEDFGVTHMTFSRDANPRKGRQTQTWIRMAGHWRVVCAHVSWGDV
ncbi:hypothetical protein PS652_01828 [Pseudomonas fluorescens]|uniref:DUF4440 domain-containing protein n=1 Tax=Pseudomonas fluorescens TaxID=294 RepID=A0A5E6SRR5_PSEFL|nr:hypothetical protein PS652_02397 [Pseudomonas fluorescens]